MTEKIFVLVADEGTGGPGRAGAPLARTARGLGLRTVLLVPDAAYYPHFQDHGWAQRLVCRTGVDVAATCASLGPDRLAGVLGDGPTAAGHAAHVSGRLGLPGDDPAAHTAADFAAWVGRLTGAGITTDPSATGPRYRVDIVAGRVVGLSRAYADAAGRVRRIDAPGAPTRRSARLLERRALAAARALNLTAGPVRIELAGTAGGTTAVRDVVPGCLDALTARVTRLATGTDPLAAAVTAAIGTPVTRVPTARRHASLCFLEPPVRDADDVRAAAFDVPGVVETGVGEAGDDAGGWIVAVAESAPVAVAAAEAARTAVLVRTSGQGAQA